MSYTDYILFAYGAALGILAALLVLTLWQYRKTRTLLKNADETQT